MTTDVYVCIGRVVIAVVVLVTVDTSVETVPSVPFGITRNPIAIPTLSAITEIKENRIINLDRSSIGIQVVVKVVVYIYACSIF